MENERICTTYTINLYDSFSNEGCNLFETKDLSEAKEYFRNKSVGNMTLLYLYEVLPNGNYKELDRKGRF